jgi:hypothetical protein
MKSLGKAMLSAALAVGAFAMTAVPAHAAKIGIFVGVGAPAVPVAYVPPSPGPGYAWVNGYWSGGYWTPGYWNYAGAGYAPAYGYSRGYYRDRDDDRRYYSDRDRDRYYGDHDRNRSFDHDRDHFRR